MDDDLSDFVEDADLDDLSSDATLGSRSNSNSHLTADGPGEFWCPVCGQRCTSNLTTGIEYGHALDCPERGSSCADRSQATEARQTCGGGGSDRGRQPRSQLGRKQGLAPDPTGGSAAAPGHGPGLYEYYCYHRPKHICCISLDVFLSSTTIPRLSTDRPGRI